MKPLLLEMNAFGPFKGKESVDFTTLGENPLFLINGPTGSGKTTILDGICYALFGQTTGEDRIAKEMRCHHSKEDILTQVHFEFELSGVRYSVLRIPEQEVAKKSGEGTTKKGAKAELWNLTKNELIANKAREISDKIESILGLNVSQFRQVMILPQGKFRALLLADSKDREAIFSKLFQTQIYKKIEMSLDSKAKDVRDKRKSSLERIQGLLEAVNVKSLEDVQKRVDELSPKFLEKNNLRTKSEKLYQEELKRFHEAEKNNSDFKKLSTAIASKSEILKKKPQIEILKDKISKLNVAKELEPTYTKLIGVKDSIESLKKNKDRAKEEEKLVTKSYNELNSKVKEVESDKLKLEKLKEKKLELRELYKVVEEINVKKARIPKLKDEILIKKSKEKEVLRKKDELILESTNKQEKISLLEKSISNIDVDHVYKEIHRHEKKKESAKKLSLKEDELSSLSDTLNLKSRELQDKARLVDELSKNLKKEKLKWHQSMASLLARELVDGEECPVCGSTEHPNIATSGAETKSDEELQALEREVSNEEKSLVVLESELKGLNSKKLELEVEINNIKKGLDGDDTKSIEAKLRDFDQNLKSVESSKNNFKTESAYLKTIDEQLDSVKKTSLEIKFQLESLQKECDSLNVDIQKMSSDVEDKYLDLDNLVKEGKGISKEVDSLEISLIEFDKTLSNARISFEKNKKEVEILIEQEQLLKENLTSIETQFNKLLIDSKLNSIDELVSLLEEYQFSSKYQSEVQDFTNQLSELEGLIKVLTEELKEKELVDLEKMSLELESCKEAFELADKEYNACKQELDSFTNIQKKVGSNQKEIDQLEAEYKVVGTLADVANGRTANKVSLQRFVLSVLLDDVLMEGSRRLKLMSKGRYELIRKLDRSRGNKASGLDIEISDTHTGRTRSASTMSGGESFLAALSLALGLSDVVQAYSGGVKLDTLFIDEGFGSLDPESLDLAVRTLIDLQSSGRTVGVISHVEGLKEQMPKRIDIISKADGSTIQV